MTAATKVFRVYTLEGVALELNVEPGDSFIWTGKNGHGPLDGVVQIELLGVPTPDDTTRDARDEAEREPREDEGRERWPVTDWRPEWEDGRDA